VAAAGSSSTPALSVGELSKAIPTNCAWSQLKSHPNIAFADLRLLADVVAGRQRCAGPRVAYSPPPAPEDHQQQRPPQSRHGSFGIGADNVSPHPEPLGVRECAREPVLEVQSASVREALAILDQRPDFPPH